MLVLQFFHESSCFIHCADFLHRFAYRVLHEDRTPEGSASCSQLRRLPHADSSHNLSAPLAQACKRPRPAILSKLFSKSWGQEVSNIIHANFNDVANTYPLAEGVLDLFACVFATCVRISPSWSHDGWMCSRVFRSRFA